MRPGRTLLAIAILAAHGTLGMAGAQQKPPPQLRVTPIPTTTAAAREAIRHSASGAGGADGTHPSSSASGKAAHAVTPSRMMRGKNWR